MASSTSSSTTLRILPLSERGLFSISVTPCFLNRGVPGLDGAPGELARVAILIGEGHLADDLDPGLDGAAFGHVDGAQHPHFQIHSGIAHECFFLSLFFRFDDLPVLVDGREGSRRPSPAGTALWCCRPFGKTRRWESGAVI
jgi:hypothetical protein